MKVCIVNIPRCGPAETQTYIGLDYLHCLPKEQVKFCKMAKIQLTRTTMKVLILYLTFNYSCIQEIDMLHHLEKHLCFVLSFLKRINKRMYELNEF